MPGHVDMSAEDLALDLGMLDALLAAADIEAARDCRPFQASAAHALQMELWRMRRPLLAQAGAHAREAVQACAPFGRVAALLGPRETGVLLSLRRPAPRTDYVQLRAADFFRAARLAQIPLGGIAPHG